MHPVFVGWIVAAVILVAVGVALGRILKRGVLGILIDTRGRYSLTQFQVVLWTILVISLIAGLAAARLVGRVEDALGFVIPQELLIVMGISLGGTAASVAIKAGKDASRPAQIAASDATATDENKHPRLSQVFLVEEGALADKVVDVTKFQNFWITIVLVVAYVFLVINSVSSATTTSEIQLPGFSGTFLVLLGISHAGYLAGKLPNQPGTPQELTVATR